MGEGTSRSGGAAPQIDYIAIEDSREFQHLRKTQRSFVLPVVTVGLVWYIIYVLLASWATDFMSTKVFGNVNWAIVIGLAQIVTTFVITMWYVSFANRKLDPEATRIREEIEAEMEVHQ
ncbi:MAG: DUF485 domain-containing protein [Bifidobacteriaceae bacterium]|jgi:uncharacterized membrane protein (DUF485 family)|nr:DUF485 domain-containing protein [Bifidobacteriaceae bacterium]